MGKIGKFIKRLLRRRGSADADIGERPDDLAGEPLKCVAGKLYRMRQHAGRWETYGPPLGDCADTDADGGLA